MHSMNQRDFSPYCLRVGDPRAIRTNGKSPRMPRPSPLPPAGRRRLGVERRRLRERADLSATQAATLLGATQSRVSNIEAGRYGVSGERVRTLARHYDCTNE